MQRRNFIVSVIAMISLTVIRSQASSQSRVAISVESDGTLDRVPLQRLIDKLTGALVRAGHFQIVDRQRVSAAIAEQGFSNSAYADPQTAAALGRIVGASRLLHIDAGLDVSETNGPIVAVRDVTVSASFQLVSVDSARVLLAGTAQGTSEGRSAAGGTIAPSQQRLIEQAIDSCAEDLAGQVRG